MTAILQGLLAKEGDYMGEISAKVDEQLKTSVKNYNAQHGIDSAGICADTWHSLFN